MDNTKNIQKECVEHDIEVNIFACFNVYDKSFKIFHIKNNISLYSIQLLNIDNFSIMKELVREHLSREKNNTKNIRLKKQLRMCTIIECLKLQIVKRVHLFWKKPKQPKKSKPSRLMCNKLYLCNFFSNYIIVLSSPNLLSTGTVSIGL